MFLEHDICFTYPLDGIPKLDKMNYKLFYDVETSESLRKRY